MSSTPSPWTGVSGGPSPPSSPRPSRWWYVLVAALVLVGAVAGGVVVGTALGATLRDTQAFPPGDIADVSLSDGDVRGLYSSGEVTGISCLVLPPAGGDQPIVRNDVPDTTATLDGVEWRLFAEVTARATGVHEVRCDSAVGSGTEFGIGPAPTVRGLVVPLAGGVALALLGGLLAVVLGVFVALRRARTTGRQLPARSGTYRRS